MTEKTFSVPDIHCGGCATSIEGALGGIDGIGSVKVDLDGQTVGVDFDESVVQIDVIVNTIEDQGYVVTS
jgi:copper ion binding protein